MQCTTEIVEAIDLRDDNDQIICCSLLPVRQKQGIGFLEPLTRKISDTCVKESCESEKVATNLYISQEGYAIRQSAGGIIRANISDIHYLNPSRGLEIFKLEALQLEEARQPDSLGDGVRIKVNYAKEMMDDLTQEVYDRMSASEQTSSWEQELVRGVLPSFAFWLVTNQWGQLILLVLVAYEGGRLVLAMLSLICTIMDCIRQKPQSKLEFIINSSTATRREQRMSQESMEHIQQKLVNDMMNVQATLSYHERRINGLNTFPNRIGRRNIAGKVYSTLEQMPDPPEDL